MKSTGEILSYRQDLLTYWREAHARWETLLDVYHGNYHLLWPGEFRRGEVPKIANWTKLGWDRYATMVGKIPVNHVPPSGLKRMTQRRADKVEKILVQYDNQSGFASLMKWYAWYLMGFGAAAIGVMPDPVLKGPRYFVKDPRTILIEPGAGSIPLSSTAYGYMSSPQMHAMTVNSMIINETQTPSALLSQYKGHGIEAFLDAKTLNTPQNVVTYMDSDSWVVLINEKRFMTVEHDLGLVPVRMTSRYVPEQLGGQSMFEQQIGLVLAYIRILNQKLTYNANIVWPWLVIRGLSDMDPATRTIKILDREGDASFLAPPGEIQAERDLETLDRLIRVMNHDTESLQGTSPGSTVTGAGVDSLNQDVRQTVLDAWDIMKPDIEYIKACALAMDEKLYPSVEKEITGKSRGETFQDTYKPGVDIRGYRNVVADFGIGVGGMEGFTQQMQLAAQGLIDETSVMESVPWIHSVSDVRRKVMLDRLEKVIFEMIASGAPVEITNRMTEWRVAIEKGKDPYKWLMENPLPPPPPPEGPPGAIPGQPPPELAGNLPPGGPPQEGGAPPQVPRTPSPSQLMALAQGGG